MKLLSKTIGSHPYIAFTQDEKGGTFYQENLDDASSIVENGNEYIFSKRFFELCKVIAKENGVTVYSAGDNPAHTGINGLAHWEDGFDKELYDIWCSVYEVTGNWNTTFIVCDDEGYCIRKFGNDRSRSSIVLKFV